MAGTVTHSVVQATSGSIARHVITWLSDGSGNASNAGSEVPRITGTILRIIEQPDTGGTKPSDNYDVTFTDESGVDLLGGQGANVDADAPIDVVPGIPFTDGTTTSVAPVTINDVPRLSVTNAGSGKGGKLIVYTR